MAKSIKKTLDGLIRVETERRELLKELARPDYFVAGSLNVISRTCGKASCHCTQEKDPGHPTSVLMSTEGNRRRCQVVRKADAERIQALVDCYRHFREGLRELKHLDSELGALLKELMNLRDQGYS
jgi:hypothetical protein